MSEQSTIRDYVETVGEGKGYPFESKLEMDEVMDKVIIVHRYFIRDREYKGEEYREATMDITFEGEGEHYVLNTSSGVLQDQLNVESEQGFPIKVKIVKRKKYYTFVSPK